MTTGLILIAAILVLGGVIASVGDRIGTKVGKARLSLFNLRPKKTAVLITLLTGSLISGTTLAILFAASEQLRTGVFKLETIQKNLRNARKEIEITRTEKGKVETEKRQVEDELAQAKKEQAEAQKRLDATNQALQLVLAKLAEAVNKQSRTESQLNQTQGQLNQTQGQLSQTQGQLNQTQGQLNQTQGQLKNVSDQAEKLRLEIQRLQIERQDLIAQRNQVKAQIAELKAQLDQRDEKIAARDRIIQNKDEKISEQDQAIASRDSKITAQDQKIAQREQEIEQRDQKISMRDQVITKQESRLKDLEKQLQDRETQIAQRDKQLIERGQKLTVLEQEVATLEQYYQNYQELRQGNVSVLRGQVLASGVVRILEPKAARQAVDQLLWEANRVAIQRIRPGDKNFKEQVILIRQTDVNRLVDQINDGKDYVVRILSAGNYVVGESPVQVFADAVPNRIVFQAGEVVASTTTDPVTMSENELRQRIDLLITASQFRARRAGIVADRIQIGDDRIETLTTFLEQLKQSKQPVDVQLVAAEATYMSGPVKMNLVAVQDGQIIFKTESSSAKVG